MQDARITLHPSQQRMQVQVDDIMMSDSVYTLEFCELAYPSRLYNLFEYVCIGLRDIH